MGLFGKKNNDKDNNKDNNMLQGDDLDALIMSAIEETDLEQAQEKEQARKNEAERVARMTEQLKDLSAKDEKKVVRRSFLMVTASERDGETFKLKGTLHGDLKTDDTVYVYHPKGTVLEAKITDVESGSDEEPENIDMTKGKIVRLSVNFAEEIAADAVPEEAVPYYSVVTNVKPPVQQEDSKAPVENPFLLGLSLEYPNYMKDKEFMRNVIKSFAEGRFIVPIHPAQPSPDGGKPIIKLITIKRNPDDKLPIVPIFSDIAALATWKELMEKGKPSVALLPFKELAKLTSKDGPDFVLNPSGPVAINIPRQIVDSIAGLVRNVESDPNAPKPRVAVGVPPKNDETDKIRKALVEYAESSPDIKALGFIATIKEGNKRGYACVVDCPKAGAKDLFQGMADKIKPYMKEVRTMEFIVKEDAKFADMYFAKIPYDYQE